MSNYLIAEIKEIQHVPFEVQHHYLLATASANETHGN
jgi:hypothetical protein